MVNHAGGISVIAFVVAVAVSMGYYQFVFIPEANAKPNLPKEARGTIGVSNEVTWTNDDVTGHTVTSDTGYVDKVNGDFDSIKQLGSVIQPGETFDFTFTEVGEYPYHCEPHPHMQGVVNIVENFA